MIVEANGVTKRFGRHEAVRALDLAVPAGAVFALIGSNGAGKSTTLRLLMNILEPDGGHARVLGVDSRRLGRRELAKIGYVAENQKLPERLTVAQYFAYVRALYPSWDRALEARLRDTLELPAGRRIGALSHGMRMKTILAAALAFRPTLLVLDEPLSGLDPVVRDDVVGGLLRETDETTIVISSHEIAEIESFTSDVAFMHEGRLLLQDSTESLVSRFKSVNVVLAGHSRPPDPVPAHWLLAEHAGRSFRFVETRFEGLAALNEQLTARMGPVRFETEPMALREIAKVVMRSASAEAGV